MNFLWLTIKYNCLYTIYFVNKKVSRTYFITKKCALCWFKYPGNTIFYYSCLTMDKVTENDYHFHPYYNDRKQSFHFDTICCNLFIRILLFDITNVNTNCFDIMAFHFQNKFGTRIFSWCVQNKRDGCFVLYYIIIKLNYTWNYICKFPWFCITFSLHLTELICRFTRTRMLQYWIMHGKNLHCANFSYISTSYLFV